MPQPKVCTGHEPPPHGSESKVRTQARAFSVYESLASNALTRRPLFRRRHPRVAAREAPGAEQDLPCFLMRKAPGPGGQRHTSGRIYLCGCKTRPPAAPAPP
ncbi:hypothetical protein NDU88_011362 [Pleurodeles waltl]|uniref:Uncharacterized protein n=1 Tax=Pleurodeles waltl TaxID=8319 RepID=A0AAV7R352_PLEWA|nr:hypothetical protein NDU88_011362 [Pleurodeles waltl]